MFLGGGADHTKADRRLQVQGQEREEVTSAAPSQWGEKDVKRRGLLSLLSLMPSPGGYERAARQEAWPCQRNIEGVLEVLIRSHVTLKRQEHLRRWHMAYSVLPISQASREHTIWTARLQPAVLLSTVDLYGLSRSHPLRGDSHWKVTPNPALMFAFKYRDRLVNNALRTAMTSSGSGVPTGSRKKEAVSLAAAEIGQGKGSEPVGQGTFGVPCFLGREAKRVDTGSLSLVQPNGRSAAAKHERECELAVVRKTCEGEGVGGGRGRDKGPWSEKGKGHRTESSGMKCTAEARPRCADMGVRSTEEVPTRHSAVLVGHPAGEHPAEVLASSDEMAPALPLIDYSTDTYMKLLVHELVCLRLELDKGAAILRSANLAAEKSQQAVAALTSTLKPVDGTTRRGRSGLSSTESRHAGHSQSTDGCSLPPLKFAAGSGLLVQSPPGDIPQAGSEDLALPAQAHHGLDPLRQGREGDFQVWLGEELHSVQLVDDNANILLECYGTTSLSLGASGDCPPVPHGGALSLSRSFAGRERTDDTVSFFDPAPTQRTRSLSPRRLLTPSPSAAVASGMRRSAARPGNGTLAGASTDLRKKTEGDIDSRGERFLCKETKYLRKGRLRGNPHERRVFLQPLVRLPASLLSAELLRAFGRSREQTLARCIRDPVYHSRKLLELLLGYSAKRAAAGARQSLVQSRLSTAPPCSALRAVPLAIPEFGARHASPSGQKHAVYPSRNTLLLQGCRGVCSSRGDSLYRSCSSDSLSTELQRLQKVRVHEGSAPRTSSVCPSLSVKETLESSFSAPASIALSGYGRDGPGAGVSVPEVSRAPSGTSLLPSLISIDRTRQAPVLHRSTCKFRCMTLKPFFRGSQRSFACPNAGRRCFGGSSVFCNRGSRYASFDISLQPSVLPCAVALRDGVGDKAAAEFSPLSGTFSPACRRGAGSKLGSRDSPAARPVCVPGRTELPPHGCETREVRGVAGLGSGESFLSSDNIVSTGSTTRHGPPGNGCGDGLIADTEQDCAGPRQGFALQANFFEQQNPKPEDFTYTGKPEPYGTTERLRFGKKSSVSVLTAYGKCQAGEETWERPTNGCLSEEGESEVEKENKGVAPQQTAIVDHGGSLTLTARGSPLNLHSRYGRATRERSSSRARTKSACKEARRTLSLGWDFGGSAVPLRWRSRHVSFSPDGNHLRRHRFSWVSVLRHRPGNPSASGPKAFTGSGRPDWVGALARAQPETSRTRSFSRKRKQSRGCQRGPHSVSRLSGLTLDSDQLTSRLCFRSRCCSCPSEVLQEGVPKFFPTRQTPFRDGQSRSLSPRKASSLTLLTQRKPSRRTGVDGAASPDWSESGGGTAAATTVADVFAFLSSVAMAAVSYKYKYKVRHHGLASWRQLHTLQGPRAGARRNESIFSWTREAREPFLFPRTQQRHAGEAVSSDRDTTSMTEVQSGDGSRKGGRKSLKVDFSEVEECSSSWRKTGVNCTAGACNCSGRGGKYSTSPCSEARAKAKSSNPPHLGRRDSGGNEKKEPHFPAPHAFVKYQRTRTLLWGKGESISELRDNSQVDHGQGDLSAGLRGMGPLEVTEDKRGQATPFGEETRSRTSPERTGVEPSSRQGGQRDSTFIHEQGPMNGLGKAARGDASAGLRVTNDGVVRGNTIDGVTEEEGGDRRRQGPREGPEQRCSVSTQEVLSWRRDPGRKSSWGPDEADSASSFSVVWPCHGASKGTRQSDASGEETLTQEQLLQSDCSSPKERYEQTRPPGWCSSAGTEKSGTEGEFSAADRTTPLSTKTKLARSPWRRSSPGKRPAPPVEPSGRGGRKESGANSDVSASQRYFARGKRRRGAEEASQKLVEWQDREWVLGTSSGNFRHFNVVDEIVTWQRPLPPLMGEEEGITGSQLRVRALHFVLVAGHVAQHHSFQNPSAKDGKEMTSDTLPTISGSSSSVTNLSAVASEGDQEGESARPSDGREAVCGLIGSIPSSTSHELSGREGGTAKPTVSARSSSGLEKRTSIQDFSFKNAGGEQSVKTAGALCSSSEQTRPGENPRFIPAKPTQVSALCRQPEFPLAPRPLLSSSTRRGMALLTRPTGEGRKCRGHCARDK
ncbi:hypothetical protein CSUI_008453 [Cystoisospora suis]|uniref:Uncharacterized protein n=1 Tax=Cystoisospora suis TaxID=483139 RepID=A0A2C6KMV4_9APIC|nr:hypothetical protein CSUI_008453 [Cystoisospora suis]